MLDIIIDNLSRIEILSKFVPTIIQIIIVSLWILTTRKTKAPYRNSLALALFLLSVSIISLVLTLTTLARITGEYAFIFLGVGILQIVFTKNDDS